MSLSVQPLPISPLPRSIMLVNRANELDLLPLRLSEAISIRLQQAILLLDKSAQQAIHFLPTTLPTGPDNA
jgi:hypothetical protein